ncbi:uncharacterized protein At5g41620 [Ananas comosus]|uniref:Uncharacterized protein At5g41620 n=1 Tax=Ananas comosus TaxID=4615 RepID=A0A6P5GMZ7_ANACO|nr:uncharacterized protein At5g41620 [Ananas comosus]
MLRHNVGTNGSVNGPREIRKRVSCSSSTSSSSSTYPSLKKNHSIKRVIVVRKKGRSTAPVPISSGSNSSESFKNRESYNCAKGVRASISARKLATLLWQMNKFPSDKMAGDLEEGVLKEARRRGSSARSSVSHCAISEVKNQSRARNHKRMIPLAHQKPGFNEKDRRSLNLHGNMSMLEIHSCSHNLPSSISSKRRMRCLTNLNNGITASKELLKVLVRIWGSGEKPSSTVPLVSALRAELDGALVNIEELIEEELSDNTTAKEGWKNKDRERFKAAFRLVVRELETEKAMRKRTERLNNELAAELAEIKASLVKTSGELKREKRSREVIKEIWNETVRGVAEDKANMEEMRMEYKRVKEEMEKEREMLQIADEWREERVQMKLSEAKLQMEEKNAAVDQLRNELDAFLKDKRREKEIENTNKLTENKNQLFQLGVVASGSEEGEEKDEEDEDEFESEDSDLHSIELNMDSKNNSYTWSYAAAAHEHKGKSVVIEDKIE